MTDRQPRILLLAMYPLDRGMWGATTRITQLRDALARISTLRVVSGTRWPRTRQLARAVGWLGSLDGIYVENPTTLPGPADLAFLALARARGIPVLTYVRDAQQLFPEYARAGTLKERLSRRAFMPALRLLMGASTRVAFPSRGLARAIHGDDREVLLLPPGSRIAPQVPVAPGARSLLFVGPLNRPAHGGQLLIDAIERVRRGGMDVRLISVSRPGEELDAGDRDWLRLVRAEGAEIDRLLPEVIATVTPRRKTPYNDLAVPIKVLEYLGYGRPLIVTDTAETAAIVRDARAGVIVPDTVEGIASGIEDVFSAPPDRRAAWGSAAREAARRNSWDVRARQILDLLEQLSTR